MEIIEYLNNNFPLWGTTKAESVLYGEYIEAYAKRETYSPFNYMKDAKTVICVSVETSYEEDIFKVSFIKNCYRGYINIYDSSDHAINFLKSKGFKAFPARELDQKQIAISSGLGFRGKQSLVVNSKYGTHLRFDTIVTNWIPESYSERVATTCPIDCSKCIDSCPNHCFESGQIDRNLCFKKYLPKNRIKLIEGVAMCNLCQVNCPYNKILDSKI